MGNKWLITKIVAQMFLYSSILASQSAHELLDFTWEKVAQEMRLHCPVLWNALVGATTTRLSQGNLKTRAGKSLLPVLGVIAGMLAYARQPRRMKAVQQLIGFQFWMGGLKRKVTIYDKNNWAQILISLVFKLFIVV